MKKHSLDYFHVLISRFSIRMHPEGAFRGRSKEWLFDVNRLQKKLVFFEHVTLANVLSFARKPNLYLILIDEELPNEIRSRLEELISDFSWIRLKPVPPGALSHMTSLGNLLGDENITAPYIVTSNLDDDDAIGVPFFENLHHEISTFIARGDSFHWFGSIDMFEWDVLPSDTAPYGYIKPYSGGVMFTLSTGYSVLSKNFKAGPTVFTLSHSRCLDFLTKQHRRSNFDRKGRFRFRLRFLLNMATSFEWHAVRLLLSKRELATRLDFQRKGEFEGLIINHGDNLQIERIEHGKERREALTSDGLIKQFNVETSNVVRNLQSL